MEFPTGTETSMHVQAPDRGMQTSIEPQSNEQQVAGVTTQVSVGKPVAATPQVSVGRPTATTTEVTVGRPLAATNTQVTIEKP